MFEVLIATIKKPYLFAQRTWYRLLHCLFKNFSFRFLSEFLVESNTVTLCNHML